MALRVLIRRVPLRLLLRCLLRPAVLRLLWLLQLHVARRTRVSAGLLCVLQMRPPLLLMCWPRHVLPRGISMRPCRGTLLRRLRRRPRCWTSSVYQLLLC